MMSFSLAVCALKEGKRSLVRIGMVKKCIFTNCRRSIRGFINEASNR